MEKERVRISWIDVAKGVLIVLVLMIHIPNLAYRIVGKATLLDNFYGISNFYSCFFMQAFFILSGLTSNFNKEAGSFARSQIKALLVPCFCLSIFFLVLDVLVGNTERFSLFVDISGQSYFLLFESYGFLMELFLAKMACYWVFRWTTNEAARCFFFLLLMAAGFGIIEHHIAMGVSNPYHYNNLLHYKDFFCMAWFVYLGTFLKRMDQARLSLWCKVSALLYVGYFAILVVLSLALQQNLLSDFRITFAHCTNFVSFYQIVPYIFVSVTGSLGLFYLCQKVKGARLLEYLGRNSLTIYCGHFFLLDCSIHFIHLFLTPDSLLGAILFFALACILTLALCYPMILLLNKRPLSYMLGK